VDEAVEAVKELLTSRGVQGLLEHTVIANPNGEGNVQEIHIEGAALPNRQAGVQRSFPERLQSRAATSIRDSRKALFPHDYRSLSL